MMDAATTWMRTHKAGVMNATCAPAALGIARPCPRHSNWPWLDTRTVPVRWRRRHHIATLHRPMLLLGSSWHRFPPDDPLRPVELGLAPRAPRSSLVGATR